jgi:choline-sulfatase
LPTRRDFLGLSAAAALAVSSGRAPGQTVSGRRDNRPNIILFVADEMRADALHCYGAPTQTPNFDQLAAEGVRFENCFVQFPVCSQSRCSFLTGWPASVHGHRSLNYLLRPDEPNLFRYLKQGGYEVLWFGKNDALAQQTFSESVSHWMDETLSYGKDVEPVRYSENPNATTYLYTPGGDRKSFSDYALVQAAIEAIERPKSDKPFCVFLPLFQPHPPYTAPPEFYSLYDPKGLPELARSDLPRKPSFHQALRHRYGIERLSDAEFRQIRAVYFGQVSYSDWLLGLVLDAMRRSGRQQDTVLFVFSDHGDYAGDYGLVEKWPSGLEDALTRVPLIVRAPDGARGHVSKEIVELYDVMQTCLDLAGVKATHTHFARSLTPQLTGRAGDPSRAAFAEGGYNAYEPQAFEDVETADKLYRDKIQLEYAHPETVSRSAMIRTREQKLIVRPEGQSELYINADDPREERNLYALPSAASVQSELSGRLLDWYIKTTGVPPFDKDSRSLPPAR